MIPFNKPYMVGTELQYIAQAHANAKLSGDGPFTGKCHAWLEERLNVKKALLTHSCTAALEMMAILGDIQQGDEVIMPSYTFVSTANAIVLRGGTPVFVDIRPDTLNIDESLITAAISKKTKAIVPVHYAGVGCEMDTIMAIAERHNLLVFEDAAQGIMSTYRNRALGSIGHMGALSFHETKNIISGEGGALLINDSRFLQRAEVIREKGTNRRQFHMGQVDKYTWVDLGSSYLPGEIVAAFLYAQMEAAEAITNVRLNSWHYYHNAFADAEIQGQLRRPIVPLHCAQNAHMYYLLLPDSTRRNELIERLKQNGIHSVFHYIPLHSSTYGKACSRTSGEMHITNDLADRLVRIPLWVGVKEYAPFIVEQILKFLQ
jgi:dTDP-4-amino-4,6-dideoxygalactose transaminase